MTGPKLVGSVRLQYGRFKKIDDKVSEQIRTVGFDTDGQAWGLVERLTRLEDAPTPGRVSIGRPMAIGRLDYHRWIRFDPIPFVEGELVTADEWKLAEPPADG